MLWQSQDGMEKIYIYMNIYMNMNIYIYIYMKLNRKLGFSSVEASLGGGGRESYTLRKGY